MTHSGVRSWSGPISSRTVSSISGTVLRGDSGDRGGRPGLDRHPRLTVRQPGHLPDRETQLSDRVVGGGVADNGDAVVTGGGLGARLSYRAEQEVPDLTEKLRGGPGALVCLLVTCVTRAWSTASSVRKQSRLLKLSEGRATAVLSGDGLPESRGTQRPNQDFVFRRSLPELLHALRAVRQEREIRSEGGRRRTVGKR